MSPSTSAYRFVELKFVEPRTNKMRRLKYIGNKSGIISSQNDLSKSERITDKPIVCASLYVFIKGILGFLTIPNMNVSSFLVSLVISFILGFIYFWSLSKASDSFWWWLILPGGLLLLIV